MKNQNIQPLTLLRWTIYNTLGWFLGIALIVVLAILSELIFKAKEDSGGQAVVGIGMGAGVGFMQWLAIRNIIGKSLKWFWFSLIGFSFAFILTDFLAIFIIADIKPETAMPFVVFAGAFITAWLQYKFVLSELFPKSLVWILYSVVGWLLGEFVTLAPYTLHLKFHDSIPKVFVFIFVFGLLTLGGPALGFITGKFIVPRLKNYHLYEQAKQ